MILKIPLKHLVLYIRLHGTKTIKTQEKQNRNIRKFMHSNLKHYPIFKREEIILPFIHNCNKLNALSPSLSCVMGINIWGKITNNWSRAGLGYHNSDILLVWSHLKNFRWIPLQLSSFLNFSYISLKNQKLDFFLW